MLPSVTLLVMQSCYLVFMLNCDTKSDRDQSSFTSLKLLKFHLNGMVCITNKSHYLIDLIPFPEPYSNISFHGTYK